ncbi:hypothetical protein Zmor_021063 [Zophobas morio]|uniref:Uncharacterized protein n=1 Tax=Zophobas morio TaxID=2755281 RepID=A0AA38MB21_9CUCU|nr:hypothetical protein Zmor_021063 [Zophobas morio]
MQKIAYTRTTDNREQDVYVPKETANFVFVRVDRVKRPLESPYDGPFKVLDKKDKFFTLLINDKPSTVSINRVKVPITSVLRKRTSLQRILHIEILHQ